MLSIHRYHSTIHSALRQSTQKVRKECYCTYRVYVLRNYIRLLIWIVPTGSFYQSICSSYTAYRETKVKVCQAWVSLTWHFAEISPRPTTSVPEHCPPWLKWNNPVAFE